jgi:lipoate-protein ligase A
MAFDEALLLEADRVGSALLRLYRWDPPCLSLGRNEPALAHYDRATIERLGIDVVRRPTGGRAVWHEHEVTYAVAAPIATFGGLREAYRWIHGKIAAALQTLGVNAALALDRPRPSSTAIDVPGGCFVEPVGGEVLVNGRKVVGSAQVRRGTAFLQHGSILLDGSQERLNTVSYQPSAVSQSTTLSAVLGRQVAFDEVASAITTAFDRPLPLSTALYRPLPPPSAFASPSWTWRR